MADSVRRINLFGSAGCGKTTMAARLFAELKMRNFSVEHVQEFIKLDAYEGRFPVSHDQVHVFASQMNREDRLLRHVKVIVTDSPIHMNIAYGKHYGYRGWKHCLALADLFEEDFPSLNFFLHRKHAFDPNGRFQDEATAVQIEEGIREMMAYMPSENVYFDDLSFYDMVSLIQGKCK
jgi:nicotinamide riboside kinase